MADIDNSKRLRKEPKMQHFVWFIHVKIHVCLYYNESFDENTAIFVLIGFISAISIIFMCINICFIFKMMTFINFIQIKQHCLMNTPEATCPATTERQCGSINQYITQKMSVILRHELLIYQHFRIEAGSGECFSFLFLPNDL